MTAPRPAAAFPDSARPRTVAGSPLVVALPADRSIGGVGGRSPRRDGRRTICSIQSIRRLTAASWRWRPVANCAAHEPRMISTPTTPLTRCRYDALTAATTTTTSLVARRSWFRLVARCRRQIMILFRGSCGAGEAKTLGPPSGRWAHYAAEMGTPDSSCCRRRRRRGRITAKTGNSRTTDRRPTRHRASTMMEIDPLRPISGPPVFPSVARSPAHPFSVQISAFFSAKIIARRPPPAPPPPP